jgi:hypothetical protein
LNFQPAAYLEDRYKYIFLTLVEALLPPTCEIESSCAMNATGNEGMLRVVAGRNIIE